MKPIEKCRVRSTLAFEQNRWRDSAADPAFLAQPSRTRPGALPFAANASTKAYLLNGNLPLSPPPMNPKSLFNYHLREEQNQRDGMKAGNT